MKPTTQLNPFVQLGCVIATIPLGLVSWLFVEWLGYKILAHFGWLP